MNDEPMAAPALGACQRALELVKAEGHRRGRLFEVTRQLMEGLASLRLDTGPCVTPWVPIWLGDETRARVWLETLAQAQVQARAWLEPGRSRLLLAPAATMSDAEIDQLLSAIERCTRKAGGAAEQESAIVSPGPLATPGTFAVGSPCTPRWQPLMPSPAERAPGVEARGGISRRIGEAVETLTWRLANERPPTVELIRALIERARRRER